MDLNHTVEGRRYQHADGGIWLQRSYIVGWFDEIAQIALSQQLVLVQRWMETPHWMEWPNDYTRNSDTTERLEDNFGRYTCQESRITDSEDAQSMKLLEKKIS